MPDSIAESHKTAIGCSKIAQALGISHWGGTPLDLWQHYTGRELLPDIGNDLRVALGEPMETVLRPFVEERLGGDLRRDRRVYQHPTLPLIGHIDFRLATSAQAVTRALGSPARVRPIVDIKTSLGPGARHRFGTDGTDELDADVLLQMHGYLLLTGATIAYVAALVPGPELKIFSVRADSEMKELIEDGLADFWRCVTTDTPPEARNEADARRLWTRHTAGKTLTATFDVGQQLRQLAQIRADMRTLEAREKTLCDALLPVLADAEVIVYGGEEIATYRANKSSEKVNFKSVAEELLSRYDEIERHQILESHTYTVPGARVLRLSKTLEDL
jgi:predicted phage-related endonuclease